MGKGAGTVITSLFSQYPWYVLWSPLFLFLLILISWLYYKKILASSLYKVSFRHYGFFYGAMLLLYIVKGSPFNLVGKDFLFSAHIFELATIHFAIIPLFILSVPVELLQKIFWHYRLRKTIKWFSYPWVAALIFNGVLTIYLVPKFFNQIHGHSVLSFISQTILVISAILMWWTIIAPLKGVGKFSYFIRVSYVFLNSLLLMPMGIFLILSILYPHYTVYDASGYRLFGEMNGISDQQLGGALLKALQLLGYGTALFYLISRWGKEEEKEDENIRVVQGIVIQLPERK
ncbi:cytochrome c oxidase assembly protein [Bacillus niameyensis]|uniref:cytochrome c oxidase assembly protein n=1 Tax=Bacillus niameyensis TaxID=1522308 RepID=UPI000780772E|nr:cytochrome c oxidase assembly protein [Bacillus niameyensis]